MTFAYAAGVITQTGTDTDLSGLTGLTGVTTLDASADTNYTAYNVGTNELIIDGVLSINPQYECLLSEFVPFSSTEAITINGTLTIGVKETSGGLVKYSQGSAIILTGEGGSNTGERSLEFSSTSILNMYGGTIRLPSPLNFSNGAEVNWENGTLHNERASFIQLRISSSGSTNNAKINFSGLTLDGTTDPVAIFASDGFGDMQLKLFRGQFQNSVNSQADALFENWDNTNNFEPDDLLANSNGTNFMTTTFRNVGRQVTVVERITNRDAYGLTERDCRINFLDAVGDAITDTVAYYGVDTNNGSRFVGYNGDDKTADQVYSGTTTAGFFEANILNQVMQYFDGTLSVDDRTNANGNIPINAVSYDRNIGTAFPEMIGLNQDVSPAYLLTDRSITEATQATVDAYTTLDTPQEFYDRAKSYLVANYLGEDDPYISRNGNDIDAGAYDVDIDATAGAAFALSGNKITIKTSDFVGNMTTTGTITLLNGATFTGTRTDSGGTISPPVTYTFQLPNIVDGSRFQIYNIDSATELTNSTTSGGLGVNVTYTKGTDYTAADEARYRVTYQSGTNAMETIEGTFTFPTDTTINSIPINQSAQAQYETFAVDGSGITEFTWDSGNIEIDINDTDNTTNIQRLGAWYYYFITTATGIDEAFDALSWETLNSIKIITANVDMLIDNTKATPLTLTGGRLYRDDGLTIITPTSNSIQIDYDPVYTIETGVSGLTAPESAQLGKIDATLAAAKLAAALSA